MAMTMTNQKPHKNASQSEKPRQRPPRKGPKPTEKMSAKATKAYYKILDNLAKC